MNFQTVALDEPHTTQFLRDLMDFGFVVVPGAVAHKRVLEIGMNYDELMAPSFGPDFKAGTTTDRRFFSHGNSGFESGSGFEDVYQHLFLWGVHS